MENIFAPSRGGSASRGASPQRPQGPRTLESYIPGARGLLQKIDQDREILARFDNSWKGKCLCKINGIKRGSVLPHIKRIVILNQTNKKFLS